MPEFDKWWDDLKKHKKRLHYWLPHWKATAAKINGHRQIRYFTLCSRSMIDVFMLTNEKLIKIDQDSRSINRVQFCECDQDQFVEIREMVAKEDAGFFGRLEDLVLFKDDDFTAQFPTLESIDLKLEDEGFQENISQVDRLQLKRTHLNVKASFPYDLINLDFCQYYYPHPPGMLRINETVERVLDWQRRRSDDSENVLLKEFILTVTCRHDAEFPVEAEARLAQLILDNCKTSPEYKKQVETTRGTTQLEDWVKNDREDFFLSGWPKDIARAAKDTGWSMEVLDYVYYQRVGDKGNPYDIACLIARFSRPNSVPDYMPAALFALDRGKRMLIEEIERTSPEGQELLGDLGNIVSARNEQARIQHRPELPHP